MLYLVSSPTGFDSFISDDEVGPESIIEHVEECKMAWEEEEIEKDDPDERIPLP